jgi:L-fucose isomerase-like protein
VLIRRFVEEGFEHHVTAVHGHWAQAAGQLAFMLGAELVRV